MRLPTSRSARSGQVILEVFQTLQGLARGKQITLRTEGLESLPEFHADERRLYNAFYNLINNAIPETPPGGSITVRGRLDQDTGGIALAVADTGRGMSPEIRDRLFSVKALSTKKGGTGLGTKIVKDVVDAHKGKIWVESEPGVGTTFHLLFPSTPQQRMPKSVEIDYRICPCEDGSIKQEGRITQGDLGDPPFGYSLRHFLSRGRGGRFGHSILTHTIKDGWTIHTQLNVGPS